MALTFTNVKLSENDWIMECYSLDKASILAKILETVFEVQGKIKHQVKVIILFGIDQKNIWERPIRISNASIVFYSLKNSEAIMEKC